MTGRLDLSKTPWNVMRNLEEAAKKERQAQARWTTMRAPAASEPACCTAPPPLGEQVTLANIQSRPKLNGVLGKVVSEAADEDGFVLVRVPKQDAPGSTGFGSWKRLRVQPRCLRPLWGAPGGEEQPSTGEGGRGPSSVLSTSHRGSGSGRSSEAAAAAAAGGLRRSASAPGGRGPKPGLGPTKSFTGVWQVGHPGVRVLGWAGH
mmetsp:Transcript_92246/g.298675  ORF Transcript_92246/g.298675 Transcript_92246/m.298675 type:complete len:205 (-) Transcript_92246:100-714(-)